MDWSKYSAGEIERRRLQSVDTLKASDRADWDREYQKRCDSLYWSGGQCCAGCDHWQSNMGLLGDCAAAGIVSGADVLRSMGFSFSSYMPAPGFPVTKATDHCGKFADDFDWPTLDEIYLHRIGAIFKGRMQDKPTLRFTKPDI